MFYRIKSKILEDKDDILEAKMYIGVEYRVSNSSCWKDLIVDGVAVGFPLGEPINKDEEGSEIALDWSGEKEAFDFMKDHFMGKDDSLVLACENTPRSGNDKNNQIKFLEIWKVNQDIRKRYFNYSAGSEDNAPIPYFYLANDARSNLHDFDALCEAYNLSESTDDAVREFRKTLNQTIVMVSGFNLNKRTVKSKGKKND